MPFTCEGVWGLTSGLPTLISSPLSRLGAERLEEAVDLLPQLPAAGEAPPARADDPDERVALVDWHEPMRARAPRVVHEQRLHIRLHRGEHRVRAFDLGPCLELELRLRGPHRPGVVRHHPA